MKEERKLKRQQKKLKKKPLQIWTSGQEQQTDFALFMNVAVRIALLCMAGAGTAFLLLQLYKIPVNGAFVVLLTVFFSLVFNAFFLLQRFRYALPLLALVLFTYLWVEDVLFDLRCFADYMLSFIDGGLLSTARYATRTAAEMSGDEFIASLQKGVIFLCVCLALLFALCARGKFIGSILIVNIIILIPAIAAQKASYVPAMTILAVSMLGLYSIWASHEQSFLKSAKPCKQKSPPYIPRVHRHAVNGAAAAAIALISALTAQALLPVDKTPEIIRFFSDMADDITEKAYEIGLELGDELGFGINVPSLNHSGYMPSGNIDAGLTIDSPTIGRRNVLNVTLEDDLNYVYLRNGIGSAFNPDTGKWDVNSKLNRMSGFPDNFYPEHEYLVFRQKALALGYDPDELIGRQQVEVEYLVTAKPVMLPTSLYIPDYKTDPRFVWRNDVILEKKSQSAGTYSWDALYPIRSLELGLAVEDEENVIISEAALTPEQARAYSIVGEYTDYVHLTFDQSQYANSGDREIPPTGALRIYAGDYGMTAQQYLDLSYEYENLVYDVYTKPAAAEAENIERLLDDISFTYAQTNNEDRRTDYFDELSRYGKAEYIEDYFKSYYTYSLIIDNNSGPNTMLGNFLFETRSGHCALYATAMTLALRDEGIPARYVTGYVTGGGGGVAEGNGKYKYTVIERDLHAWVEVYFEGVGWLPFDPTPPIYEYVFLEAERTAGAEGTLATTTPATTTPRPETTPRATTTPPETTPPQTTPATTPALASQTTLAPDDGPLGGRFTAAQIISFAVILLVAALIAASVVIFIKVVSRTEKKYMTLYKRPRDRATAHEAYLFMLRLLKIEGLTGAPGETPVKFAVRVDETIKELGMTPIINVLQKLEFSREELSPREYDKLSAAVALLYKKIVTEKRGFKRFVRKIIAFDIIK